MSRTLGSTPVGEGCRTRCIGGATDLVVNRPDYLKTGSNSRSAPISSPQTVISNPNSSGLFARKWLRAPATMNDEGLADVEAAGPFRLPRLHSGIGGENACQPARGFPGAAGSDDNNTGEVHPASIL